MKRWTESLSMREGSLSREVEEAKDDYIPLAELRSRLPDGMALCRRCVSVGVPDTRYLCKLCTSQVNAERPGWQAAMALGLGTMPEMR